MSFRLEPRFLSAIATFDRLNAADPNHVIVDGKSIAKELHDAEAMTRWIESLYPEASEAVFLAARCQHLCRWEISRGDFPEGKIGYHNWRNALKKFHAEKSAEVLCECGYGEAMIQSVSAINLKKGLKTNEDVQQIEDALCLVFLQNHFESYLDKWDEEKIIGILRKTWVKMSEVGHSAAESIVFSKKGLAIVQSALSGVD